MSFQLFLNKKVKFNYYIIFYLFGKFWNKYTEGEI